MILNKIMHCVVNRLRTLFELSRSDFSLILYGIPQMLKQLHSCILNLKSYYVNVFFVEE